MTLIRADNQNGRCPECGSDTTEVTVDHTQGSVTLWPCRHTWPLMELTFAAIEAAQRGEDT